MGKRTDKYKSGGEDREVDLLPFMNLLAILIPALMISTEYIKIASIAVASPKLGPASTEPSEQKPDEKPPLNLTIAVTSLGFYIASSSNVLPGSENQEAAAENKGPTIPKVNVKVYTAKTASGKTEELMRVWEFEGKKYKLGVREVTSEEVNARVQSAKDALSTVQITDQIDYNYPALHKKLKTIKEGFEKEKQVIVSAEPNIKFTTVIRVMDASRGYTDKDGEKKFLFPQVVLSAGVV